MVIRGAMVGAVCFSLAACQNVSDFVFGPSNGGSKAPSSVSPRAADVRAQIVTAGGPLSQVDHYTLTLKQNGSAVMTVAGNPVTLAPTTPASSTFNAVPDGTNYIIEADGLDAGGTSVTTGAATSSAFDIVDGAIVNHGTGEAAPNPIPVTLTILSMDADVTVEINVAGGSASQVDHYLLTLQQDGAPVAMVGNPVTLGPQAPIAPFNSTFSAVPNGTNYSIVVDGRDACGSSVATGAVTSAAFDIVNGAVSNQPNPIPLTLTLQEPVSDLTVQVSGGAAGAMTGSSLLNLANFTTAAVAARSVATSPTDITIANVSPGATTGNSHKLFHYFVDASNQATVAKSRLVAGNCVGKIGSTPVGLNYSMVQAPTDVSTDNAALSRLHTGGLGHAYFYNAAAGSFLREDNVPIDISSGGMAIPVLPIEVFAVTAVNGHDTIVYFDPNDGKIKRNDDRGMIAPSDILDLTGNFTAIIAMAVDAGGAIYWIDHGRVWKLPANIANPTFADATEIINSGPVTDLAVDAFGNIIYVVGFTAIHRATLGTANGTDYTPTGEIVTGTPVVIGSLSADAVGNIYYQDTYTVSLKMVARGNDSTVYDVVGTGNWRVVYPSVGADGTLYYIDTSGGGPTYPTMRR